MICFLILALLLITPKLAFTQNQSISLPVSAPIHCSKQADNCNFLFGPHTTAVLVAKQGASGIVADSWGNTWTLDQCTTYDNGDCIFHSNLSAPYSGGGPYVNCCAGNHLTLSGNNFTDVWILLYDGIWKFDSGNYGTYADQNFPFPDCMNTQGSCPYNWTLPIETEAGSLIVAWSNSNTQGIGIARPGAGYSIEASDGVLAVEDMIAPVDGVYIGSLIWRNADGSPGGGSHWLMGIAAYKRVS